MNWKNYKFHPSSVGVLMTDSRTKEPLGETCKKHLMECYVEEIYKRKREFSNKYVEKGIACEEDSLTLYSRVTKTFHKKNKQVFENDYFKGTPDIITPEAIIEIKTSWDIFTFHGVLSASINKNYFWQVQAYMELVDRQTAKLVYCLVDATPEMVQDQKRRLAYSMHIIDDQASPEYLEACKEIDKAMTFDDIPIEERWLKFTLDRDEKLMEKAHQRVEDCREFLTNLTKPK